MRTASTRSSVRGAPGTPDWVQIVRAEYLESPGLYLTKPQAQRLFGLDAGTCDRVLATLIDERFLTLTAKARYARVESGR
jgi:hypothetical protein